MTGRSLENLRQEAAQKRQKLEQLKHSIETKEKSIETLARSQRDNFRYVIGGLLVENLNKINPTEQIMLQLYNFANKRDRIKFVKFGYVDEDLAQLYVENKQQCRESVSSIPGNESAEEQEKKLSENDQKKLEDILEIFAGINPLVNRKRQIYGRQGELTIYIGDNIPMRISDELAAYLRDHCDFNA